MVVKKFDFKISKKKCLRIHSDTLKKKLNQSIGKKFT